MAVQQLQVPFWCVMSLSTCHGIQVRICRSFSPICLASNCKGAPTGTNTWRSSLGACQNCTCATFMLCLLGTFGAEPDVRETQRPWRDPSHAGPTQTYGLNSTRLPPQMDHMDRTEVRAIQKPTAAYEPTRALCLI